MGTGCRLAFRRSGLGEDVIFVLLYIRLEDEARARRSGARTAEMFAHFCSHLSAWFLTLHEKKLMRPRKGEYEIKR